MKHTIFSASLFAMMLAASGCHKTAPVASAPRPVDTTPVAAAPAAAPAARQAPARATPAPAARAAQPPTSREMPASVRASLNERLAKLEDALFDYDKSTIRADASTALKEDVGVVRDILATYPNQKLLIEGFADERGSEEYNLALGDRRARSAQDFLTSMGIPTGQLTVISYGKERPVCTEQTEECWQKNRRVHMTAAP